MKRQWGFTAFAIICAGLIVTFFTSPHIAQAAVSVANQTGTIAITTPTGEVITVEAGQPLPAIASGSTIEVITGSADISASGGDSVNVLINGATAMVQGGAQVSVRIDLRTGDAHLNVVTGYVPVTRSDGTVQILGESDYTSTPAPTPTSTSSGSSPANPTSDVGRQEDIESGTISGY